VDLSYHPSSTFLTSTLKATLHCTGPCRAQSHLPLRILTDHLTEPSQRAPAACSCSLDFLLISKLQTSSPAGYAAHPAKTFSYRKPETAPVHAHPSSHSYVHAIPNFPQCRCLRPDAAESYPTCPDQELLHPCFLPLFSTLYAQRAGEFLLTF